MVSLEQAKRIALDKMNAMVTPNVILYEGKELTDGWLFNFATKHKVFIPGYVLRVYKENGRCVDFDPFVKEQRQDAHNKFVRDFVITEGCHW